jgi:hypothetical protein
VNIIDNKDKKLNLGSRNVEVDGMKRTGRNGQRHEEEKKIEDK